MYLSVCVKQEPCPTPWKNDMTHYRKIMPQQAPCQTNDSADRLAGLQISCSRTHFEITIQIAYLALYVCSLILPWALQYVKKTVVTHTFYMQTDQGVLIKYLINDTHWGLKKKQMQASLLCLYFRCSVFKTNNTTTKHTVNISK